MVGQGRPTLHKVNSKSRTKGEVKMKKMIAAMMIAGMITGFAMANEGHDMKNMDKKHEVKNAKVQTICPVMGKPIDKKLYVDHNGERIYVCCKGCIKPVTKNPEKWIKKIEATGATVEKIATAQTTCPVMGKPIDKKLYVDHNGERIYVCCQGCIGIIKKNPEKWMKKLEAKGVTPEKVK